MHKIGALVTVTQIVWAGIALAADLKARPKAVNDPTSSWDITFGGSLMSDYNIRGISQSARKPSLAGNFEPRYNISSNLQLYVGFSGEAIDFPNHAAAEIDIYGGVRPTFGKLYLDFGVWSYKYPRGTTFSGLGVARNVRQRCFLLWPVQHHKGEFELLGDIYETYLHHRRNFVCGRQHLLLPIVAQFWCTWNLRLAHGESYLA